MWIHRSFRFLGQTAHWGLVATGIASLGATAALLDGPLRLSDVEVARDWLLEWRDVLWPLAGAPTAAVFAAFGLPAAVKALRERRARRTADRERRRMAEMEAFAAQAVARALAANVLAASPSAPVSNQSAPVISAFPRTLSPLQR